MIALIRTAFGEGVSLFDCAEGYGPDECERILGEATEPFCHEIQETREFGFDVELETGKRSGRVASDPARTRAAVDGSVQRFGTDRADLLNQHRVDPDVPIDEVAGVVSDLRPEGKVPHCGLSQMGPDTLPRARALVSLGAVQNEYSMLYRVV